MKRFHMHDDGRDMTFHVHFKVLKDEQKLVKHLNLDLTRRTFLTDIFYHCRDSNVWVRKRVYQDGQIEVKKTKTRFEESKLYMEVEVVSNDKGDELVTQPEFTRIEYCRFTGVKKEFGSFNLDVTNGETFVTFKLKDVEEVRHVKSLMEEIDCIFIGKPKARYVKERQHLSVSELLLKQLPDSLTCYRNNVQVSKETLCIEGCWYTRSDRNLTFWDVPFDAVVFIQDGTNGKDFNAYAITGVEKDGSEIDGTMGYFANSNVESDSLDFFQWSRLPISEE